MRRRFDYATFVAGWRAIAADHGIDPISGQYRYAEDAGWWKNPAFWHDPGPAHSVVEREAIASIAQQARAAHGLGEPRTLADAMTTEFRAIVKEALADDLRAKRRNLPLSELHRLRGVTVEEVAGQRMEVLIKQMA